VDPEDNNFEDMEDDSDDSDSNESMDEDIVLSPYNESMDEDEVLPPYEMIKRLRKRCQELRKYDKDAHCQNPRTPTAGGGKRRGRWRGFG
jgi:hypothetical protein